MSLDTSLLIASGSLANINRQMAVVSQNVANANTPAYAREISSQSSLAAGGQGMGVRTNLVGRDVDLSLQADLLGQNASVAAQTTTSQALSAIDAVQGTPGDGTDLASRLGAVSDAFSSLLTDPGNTLQQSRVVTAAGDLAAKINSMQSATADARQTAQDSLVGQIGTLNATLGEIGGISDQIVKAQAAGQSTAQLENQRDAAVTRLSSLLDVRSQVQPDGDLLLMTGASTILPTHGGAGFSLAPATLSAGAAYPGQGVPGVMLGGTDVTTGLRGGSIGANLTLRDTTLPTYQAQLDEFAQTLSTRMDQQGLALFTDGSGAVPAASGGPPAQSGYIGYSAVIQVNPAVTANPALVRDGSHDVTGSAGGATDFTANPTDGPVGFSTLITRITRYGFGASVQAGVAQPAPLSGGLGVSGRLAGISLPAGDLASFASALVSNQAADAGRASSARDAATTSQVAMQAKVAARSGVNIDTEMSTMLGLQSSYAATAKIVSAVQAMWTATLDMVQ